MNAPLGLFASLLLAAALGIAAGAIIAALLGKLPLRGGYAAAARADGCLALLLLPPALGLILCSAVLAPALAHQLGVAPDHCLARLHQAPICPSHSPLLAGGTVEGVFLILTGLLTATTALWGLWRLVLTQRLTRRLAHFARPPGEARGAHGAGASWFLLPTRRPLAFTSGILRPRTYLSTGLLEGLDPASIAAVAAHEEAHRRRRDGLRLLLAEIARPFHLPATARTLHEALARSTEEACDEQAARSAGGRHDVAKALIRCSRLMAAGPIAPATPASPVARAGHHGATAALCERVERLLLPTHGIPGSRPCWALLPVFGAGAVVAALALGGHPGVHHTVESLVAVLAS